VPDDELDLDMELNSEPQPARKTPPWAKASRPAAEPGKTAEPAPATGPAVVPARRPGILQKVCAPFKAFFGRFHLPPWNARTFIIGLAILLLLLVIVENWPPVRLSLLGLHADIPKAVVLIVVFALGYLAAWNVMRKPRKQAEGGEG